MTDADRAEAERLCAGAHACEAYERDFTEPGIGLSAVAHAVLALEARVAEVATLLRTLVERGEQR
jgi:hypothetical protein